jgi:hypothetical protein
MTIRELRKITIGIIKDLDKTYGEGTADIDVVICSGGGYHNNIKVAVNDKPIHSDDDIRTLKHIIGKSKHNKAVIYFGD